MANPEPGHLFAVSGFCTNSRGKYLVLQNAPLRSEASSLPCLPFGALQPANLCLLQTEISLALKLWRTFNTFYHLRWGFTNFACLN